MKCPICRKEIAQDNPEAAARMRRAIRIAIDRLAQHPNFGRAGRIEGTRELIISNAPYIVDYRVVEDQLRILAILHTSRRWPRRF